MENFYNKVRQLLVENRSKLDALTKHLIDEKTLLGNQVQEILKCA
jgi:ATP-dependent Zn protease